MNDLGPGIRLWGIAMLVLAALGGIAGFAVDPLWFAFAMIMGLAGLLYLIVELALSDR